MPNPAPQTAAATTAITALGCAVRDPAAQVYRWILAGASEDEIAEALDQLFPKAKPKPLMIAAMKRIADAAQVDRDCLIGWCIESTRLVYQRAVESGDWSAALRAIKQLHALGTHADKEA